jgi:hypothetical protein
VSRMTVMLSKTIHSVVLDGGVVPTIFNYTLRGEVKNYDH